MLDPRASVEEAVNAAVKHGANLLLAELIGAAVHFDAAIRISAANSGKTWPRAMESEGIDFDTVDV